MVERCGGVARLVGRNRQSMKRGGKREPRGRCIRRARAVREDGGVRPARGRDGQGRSQDLRRRPTCSARLGVVRDFRTLNDLQSLVMSDTTHPSVLSW